MNTLTTSNINEINHYLESNGLHELEVRDDVLDHICCLVEEQMETGLAFDTAFLEVKGIFSPKEVNTLQSDTTYFLTIKNTIMMIKGIFITAYLSVTLYALGFGLIPFFEFIFFGQGEMIMLMTGVIKLSAVSVFCFGFLPLLFAYGYRRFTKQLMA